MYDANLFPTPISKVTDAILEQIIEGSLALWMKCTPLFI
nr:MULTISPECIES: hypothetical protein [unclassified Vibrio]